MGIFGKILDKLGIHKAHAASAPSQPAASDQSGTSSGQQPSTSSPSTNADPAQQQPSSTAQSGSSTQQASTQNTAPQSISQVDVVKQLDQKAANNSQQLNWKTSIVDLLKLLDMDSSLEARKELAKELNCPPDLMHDSAQMNMWLHKEVLKRIADNGGNIPNELLH